MAKAKIGLIGLAVMGENLALNIANNGFPIAVYNRTAAVTEAYIGSAAKGKPINAAYSVEDFVASLETPRRIIIMVKAGSPVDTVIEQLIPFLKPGDVVMDCGNSYFPDTARRSQGLQKLGINFFGVGVSGGEEGALNGPSIMPGGPPEAYGEIEPILTKIAARAGDEPCVAYMGRGAAGHYVKMVHNGIEYGDMQLIAEAYDLLSRALGLSAPEIGRIFADWNKGELDSYLIEITANVLQTIDADTKSPMVDVILDKAGQKGTGRWTAQDALELGIPVPTIEAALWARNISARKDERVGASAVLKGPRRSPKLSAKNGDRLIASVKQALYASKIASYAQGMSLLQGASLERRYELNLAEIAKIWRAGCIIRARLLEEIRAAYTRDPTRSNLLLDTEFREAIDERQAGWRYAVTTARAFGIPCPATSASLDYYDSYRTARLPANLIQGQRDYFGAHTYERVDRPGVFHTEWIGSGGLHGPGRDGRVATSDPVVGGVAVQTTKPTDVPAPVSGR